ncbi:MAG: transcriptional regulator [Acidimicrobiia bacterium]
MRSREEYERVMSLIADGLNDMQVARETGIPRATVRDWRAGVGWRHREGNDRRSGIPCDARCDSIAKRALPRPWAYAHLLGLYLGDGTITEVKRGVTRLRIFLDEKYPDIIDGCIDSMKAIRGTERISVYQHTGCLEIFCHWKHWPCVFPQHGPGMKHTRLIELTAWQRAIVEGEPKAFLRGLYESDGNRHINPITRRFPSGTRHYRYSRYMFSNESNDIQQLFKDTCDLLGVHWTQANRKNVAVSRREDVAFLDEFLGPKT